MRLIKPSFEIIEQDYTLNGIYKIIEQAGRTCYKSEDKITETSAKEFVDRMIKSGHGAMLEHGTVYLDFTDDWQRGEDRYIYNKYSKVYKNTLENGWLAPHLYVTTNLRVLVENNWLDDLKYLCGPTKYHEKRYTVKFTTDQGILREFTRHRSMSFAVESTRYCNYSKDKFNNEVTFIEPLWLNDDRVINSRVYDNAYEIFYSACEEAEGYYFMLLENGFKPQDARNVLPLSTKCEMIMTGFVSDWRHLFRLRTSFIAETGNPHPSMSNLCDPLYKEFVDRGLMESLV